MAVGWRSLVGTALVVAAGLAMTMPPSALAAADWRAVVLVLTAIAFWALAILPEDVTALAFFAAAMVVQAAPADVVFSGFHAAAVWLVFGGLIIGAAVAATGLDRALAQRFRPLLSQSYGRCLAVTVVMAIALAFLVPSTMTRVILLVPVIAALAREVGYDDGSPGFTGLVLAAVLASYYPAVAILPAAVPTVALVGAADALHGVRLTYAQFLGAHGPTLLLLKATLIVVVLGRLFPAPAPRPIGQATTIDGDPRRGRLAVLLAFSLALWATDAVHGIAPAWVALAAGVFCVLPRVGVLTPSELQAKVNLRPGFYVAGILGVGAVLAETGLGADAVRGLATRGWLAPDQDLANAIVLAIGALATGAVATMPGIAAVLVPIAGEIGDATGMDLAAVFRAYVLGYATAFLPYQVPPMIVGLSLAGVGVAAAARATLVLAGLSFVLVWPLTLGWWWLIA